MIKFFSISLFFFLWACSGYEFVYSDKPIIKEIKNNASVIVGGSDSTATTQLLKNKLGKVNSKQFLITASVVKKITPITIEKDGSVTKHEIKHVINYIFENIESKCEVFSKEISTTTTYNSSASGFSFASDVGKDETNKQNIKKNIENFLDYIVSNISSLSCENES